jgi:hypothetical protein
VEIVMKRCIRAVLSLVAVGVVGAALDPRFMLAPLFESQPEPAGRAAEVVHQTPIVSDVATMAEIEPSLKLLQERRVKTEQHALETDDPASHPSGNRWDRIDRTALRHTSTLDYFLGFGY